MKVYNAKRLHESPNQVYIEAHKSPVIIRHRSFGDLVLMPVDNIFSRHVKTDDSVVLHLRNFPELPRRDKAA